MQLIEGYIDTQRGSFGNIGSFNILDSVELVLTITGGSKVWNNPIFELHAVKADKTEVRQTSNITIVDKTNKTLKIKLDEQMTTCLGILKLQLVIKDNDRTSSTIFKLNVNESLEYSTVRSANSIKIYADLEELNKTLTANEDKRVEAERLRVQAENSRNEAENTRVSTFNEIKSNWEIIKDDDYKLEVHNSRTSMFEGEKNTLDERLNTDFSEINKKFDEGQFIEYEGQNITASNSLAGYTKDIKIEGKTYQNLNQLNRAWTINVNSSLAYITINEAAMLKANTKYTLYFEGLPSDKPHTTIIQPPYPNTNNLQQITLYSSTNRNPVVFITPSNLSEFRNGPVIPHIYNDITQEIVDKTKVILLEGDYTSKVIPQYFEGIKSVGEIEKNKIGILSCGKNIYNKDITLNNPSQNLNRHPEVNRDIIEYSENGNRIYFSNNLKINTQYTFSCEAKLIELGSVLTQKWINFYIVYTDGSSMSYRTSNVELNDWTNIKFITDINKTVRFIMQSWSDGRKIAIDLNSIQLEENSVNTPYEPHKECKKDILLTKPLRGLPTDVKDTIEFINNKWCHVQRTEKVTAHNWHKFKETTNYISCISNIQLIGEWSTNEALCNLAPLNPEYAFNTTNKACALDQAGKFYLCLSKSKLSTPDFEGFKSYLQTNPCVVYGKLETPIITPLDLNPNLISWEGTTHIFSENSISPSLSCKVSTNIPALLSDLKIENNCLKNDLISNNEMILNSSIYSLENDYRLTLLELGLL